MFHINYVPVRISICFCLFYYSEFLFYLSAFWRISYILIILSFIFMFTCELEPEHNPSLRLHYSVISRFLVFIVTGFTSGL